MLNEKDYCDYDTWSALKELGCDIPRRLIPDYFGVLHEPQFEETLHIYDAQKWLREEKKLYVEVTIVVSGKNYMFEIYDTETAMLKRFVEEDYSTYEEALLEGIKEAIKYIQKA